MTFQQHFDILANLISTYSLEVVDKQDGSQQVKGLINNRSLSIFVRYSTQTIMYADTRTGETKTYHH